MFSSSDGGLLAQPFVYGIQLYDTVTGNALRCFACGSDAVAFSPDNRLLAASGRDGASLWETATGTMLTQTSGHRGQVTAVAWSADGRTLATGGDDSTVLLWDAAALVRRPAPPSQRRRKWRINGNSLPMKTRARPMLRRCRWRSSPSRR